MVKPVIAILGGSGALGGGLARRWAKNDYEIIIGSRTKEKAEAAARDIGQYASGKVTGLDNLMAAEKGDIVVLTVPFPHHKNSLTEVKAALSGKILIDVTVPLMPPKVGLVQLPEGGSAGQIAQDLLGESVRVVSAFQNVAAHHLNSDDDIECDVLVTGNDKDARETVIALAADADMRAFHAGPIGNSAAAEALTSVLIQINRRYKCHAGIRITGPANAD